MQKDITAMGVCSFCLNLGSVLMWSHYAESHTGICLYYEIPAEFIGTNDIMGWAPVRYGDNVFTEWLAHELNETLEPSDACMAILKRVLTIKGDGWRYEEEGRIVRIRRGLVDVPREYLKQVCFGLRTPNEDREKIAKTISAHYAHVKYAEMVHDPDADTGIKARELSSI